MENAIKFIYDTLYVFRRDAFHNLETGEAFLKSIIPGRYHVKLDKILVSMLLNLKFLVEQIENNPKSSITIANVIKAIATDKYAYFSDADVRQFYSLWYLTMIYIVIGSYTRATVLSLTLSILPKPLLNLISSYDVYSENFYGVIISDIQTPIFDVSKSVMNPIFDNSESVIHYRSEEFVSDHRILMSCKKWDIWYYIIYNINTNNIETKTDGLTRLSEYEKKFIILGSDKILLIFKSYIAIWNLKNSTVTTIFDNMDEEIIIVKLFKGHLALYDAYKIYIININTGQVDKFAHNLLNSVNDFDFISDDDIGIHILETHSVYVLNIINSRFIKIIEYERDYEQDYERDYESDVKFLRNGKIIWKRQGHIEIWNYGEGNAMLSYIIKEQFYITDMRILSDDLLLTYKDKDLRNVYNINNGQLYAELPINFTKRDVPEIIYLIDDKIAIINREHVEFWNLKSKTQYARSKVYYNPHSISLHYMYGKLLIDAEVYTTIMI